MNYIVKTTYTIVEHREVEAKSETDAMDRAYDMPCVDNLTEKFLIETEATKEL